MGITIASGSGAAVGCRLTKSADQSVTFGATGAAISFDGEAFDTDGFHDNVTNNTRITIPAGMGGVYALGGGMQWGGANTAGQLFFRVNGSGSVPGGERRDDAAAGMNTATLLNLAAGDYVELWVLNGAGSGSNTVRGGNSSSVDASFYCNRIGA